ncbi:NRDE family protein [Pseudoxanthomonas wuyuanensis]
MCVLALAWNYHPRWRLLLAGNRDEFHQRPTAALSRWSGEPSLLAGRDLVSGGTWAGIDDRGRLAVVTNVRDPRMALAQAPSRGGLVSGFLQQARTVDEFTGSLMAHASAYAPFNLLLADADGCRFISNHPVPRQRTVAAGVHGLSNGDLDEPWPKTRELSRKLTVWVTSDSDEVAPLWQALADRSTAADGELPDTGIGLERERLLSPAFISSPVYGTRASTLIAIGHDGRGWISERRFGPDGVFEGETTLSNVDC